MKIDGIRNEALKLSGTLLEKNTKKILKSLNSAQRSCLLSILSNPDAKETDFEDKLLTSLHTKLSLPVKKKGFFSRQGKRIKSIFSNCFTPSPIKSQVLLKAIDQYAKQENGKKALNEKSTSSTDDSPDSSPPEEPEKALNGKSTSSSDDSSPDSSPPEEPEKTLTRESVSSESLQDKNTFLKSEDNAHELPLIPSEILDPNEQQLIPNEILVKILSSTNYRGADFKNFRRINKRMNKELDQLIINALNLGNLPASEIPGNPMAFVRKYAKQIQSLNFSYQNQKYPQFNDLIIKLIPITECKRLEFGRRQGKYLSIKDLGLDYELPLEARGRINALKISFDITTTTLKEFVSYFPNLTHLDIENATRLTGDITFLNFLPNLSFLKITDPINFSEDMFCHFSGLKLDTFILEYLDKPLTLGQMVNCPRHGNTKFGYPGEEARLTGKGLSFFSQNQSQLKHLKIVSGYQIANIDLQEMANHLLGLTELTLGAPNLKKEDLAAIGKFTNLKALTLNSCLNLTDEGLAEILQTLLNLSSLDISKCPQITTQGVKHLQDVYKKLVIFK